MNPRMQYSKVGLALTERFEGCRLAAYRDVVGIPTIGYGHTHGVRMGMTCTQPEAEAWLAEDTLDAQEAVNDLVQVALSQDEFDALVDFTFNLGATALAHSTLLRLLNAGDIAAAADQFDLWDHAGGQVVAGLLRRRIAERQEFTQGG